MLRLLIIAGVITMSIPNLPGAPLDDGDAATIMNSGSTNRAGFRIVVKRSGVAELTSTPRGSGGRRPETTPVRRTLPVALVESFYSDLMAAKPFDSLPEAHCPKSASFGSTLTVEFGNEETPDLSCGDGGNPAMRDLIRDTNQIVALLQGN
jgi:hypothetical protein